MADGEPAAASGAPTVTRVVSVPYCEVSGLPFEYCEFSPQFEKCKAWFKENFHRFYPDVSEEDQIVELMTRLGFEGETDAAAKKAQSSKKKAADAEAADGQEGVTEAKPKKKEANPVVIELASRNKKKHVTSVKGLEGFGVDAAAAAKVFGKKFACGSALQKGKNGLPDQIEIQGNYIEELPGFINEKYKIDLKDISLVEGGKKTKASEAAAVDN